MHLTSSQTHWYLGRNFCQFQPEPELFFKIRNSGTFLNLTNLIYLLFYCDVWSLDREMFITLKTWTMTKKCHQLIFYCKILIKLLVSFFDQNIEFNINLVTDIHFIVVKKLSLKSKAKLTTTVQALKWRIFSL